MGSERPQDIVARLEEPAAPLVSGYGSSKSVGTYAYVTQFVPQEGSRPRLLTQRECNRLQGFPESFSLDHCADQHMAWYKRMGNAVSVPVATAVADALVAALQAQDPDPSFLPGTKVALLATLDACPAPLRPQFLARTCELPQGAGRIT